MFKRLIVPQSSNPPVAPALVPAPMVLSEPQPQAVSGTGKHFPKLSKEFLLAGRAVFTVNNDKGEHYTYKVRGKDGEYKGEKQRTFFLSVKKDSLQSRFGYVYIGIVNPDKGTIKCTTKSHFMPGQREYDVAAWASQCVIQKKLIPDNYQIQHAGRCGRCAKLLTDPQSIERGIGPDCWKVMHG